MKIHELTKDELKDLVDRLRFHPAYVTAQDKLIVSELVEWLIEHKDWDKEELEGKEV